MRLFFALPIEPQASLKISQWREHMFPPMLKPVPAANFHITLAFLGELPDRQLESLCDKVDEKLASKPVAAFELTIDQTGYWEKQELLWIGPKCWPDQLNKLSEALYTLSGTFNVRKPKRAFQPHITLARKCQTPAKPADEPALNLCCDHFSLYQSLQTRSGVRYEELASWHLSANNSNKPLAARPYGRPRHR